jgi:hypothetical protein
MISFSKGRWNSLAYLELKNQYSSNKLNHIGNNGCKILSRVHLPLIKRIAIRIIIAIKKIKTVLRVSEYFTYRRPIGAHLSNSPCVNWSKNRQK